LIDQEFYVNLGQIKKINPKELKIIITAIAYKSLPSSLWSSLEQNQAMWQNTVIESNFYCRHKPIRRCLSMDLLPVQQEERNQRDHKILDSDHLGRKNQSL
jgi:hypothetical protein